MKTKRIALAIAILWAGPVLGAPLPIIDVHLHALHAADQGPPPVIICAPYDEMPIRDPRWSPDQYFAETFKKSTCRHPLTSAPDDATLKSRSLAYLERYNITAVTSGTPGLVEDWRKAAPNRIIPGIMFGASDLPSIDRLRTLHKAGQLAVLGEIGSEYDGVSPDDSRLEPYFALAEELDIPVAIHMGPGPPGAAYLGMPFKMRLTDPLLLEDVLGRHPRLRIYVMHAGWPMIDRMIALLYAHPQVYVDTGVIDYTQPRAEFWLYLKRLVDAGYGKRVMFGSDQMVWPDAIPAALSAIETAPFLSAAQKRDILYNNAARFLRLDETRPMAGSR
ncbi:MAG: amidohydrolase family protein [Sphingomonas bacterium]